MQAISYRHENRMEAGHFVYSKLIVKRHDNGWYPLTYFEVSGSIRCYVMSYFKVSGYHPLSCHVLLQSKWIPSAVMPLHYQLTVRTQNAGLPFCSHACKKWLACLTYTTARAEY